MSQILGSFRWGGRFGARECFGGEAADDSCLTEFDFRVLQCMREALTEAEIAQRLKRPTVEVHRSIRRLVRRLGHLSDVA